MAKLRILWVNKNRKDILLWDNTNEKKIQKSFGTYSWTSLNTSKFMNIAPLYLIQSLKLVSKNIQRTSFCSAGFFTKSKINILSNFFSYLLRIKYIIKCILSLTVVLYYKPKLIISYIDNSISFQYLDSIISTYIPVITVQNGNRWHYYNHIYDVSFRHFYNPPSYHSCFAVLSEIDIFRYKESGWICGEYHNIGSIGHDSSFAVRNKSKIYDLCIIANSNNNRLSEKKLAKLIKNFQKNRNLKICIALKRSPKDKKYMSHYQELHNLYGEFANLIPNNNTISLFCNSEVILGTFSTALREVFSLGKKIYPINFDFEKEHSYMNCLNINLSPKQSEFNKELDKLLALNEQTYKKMYSKQIKYIGCLPQNVSSHLRLSSLINLKIKSLH